ncbi:hypothetical protein CAter282_1638 [Collimonas arenae]|uniref:Uncharacterized protein n=1 Tax=Collimonas arenae TaxID=279058 RepID=A0A127PNY0_9BURK|nr:hypothetical protein CAter10_1767 [Collimonas arenae]AMP09420.1 hypothetical protein CAter282_1638 [Collimonas arenae]
MPQYLFSKIHFYRIETQESLGCRFNLTGARLGLILLQNIQL